MRELKRRQARPIDTFRRQEEQPTDYGRHTRRCPECSAWLCRYHEGPLCWPCELGFGFGDAEGIVIQVAPGEWRKFAPTELMRDSGHSDRLRADDFAELMGEA